MDLATAVGFCIVIAIMCFASCFYTNFNDDQDADEQKDDVKYDVKYENGSDNFIPFAVNVKIVPACLISVEEKNISVEEKSSVQHKHVVISNNETNILNV